MDTNDRFAVLAIESLSRPTIESVQSEPSISESTPAPINRWKQTPDTQQSVRREDIDIEESGKISGKGRQPTYSGTEKRTYKGD
jgi:hypothetical protein